MADKATAEKWLAELTHIPTASGLEDGVVAWVETWAGRRSDLEVDRDSGGNLLITQKGRKKAPPVLAVAHMDHPAFVVTGVDGAVARFEFRGGVDPVYFTQNRVVIGSSAGSRLARIGDYDPEKQTGTLVIETGTGDVKPGDIGMWSFPPVPRGGMDRTMFRAPACDDLAGVAASLAALDKARRRPALKHFGVLLTRAEEVGLIGAIHAAKHQTIPRESRLISVETSRELPTAPIGEGPIIRVGDRASVFDRDLTNRLSQAAAAAGIRHQRKLMDGGGCEATAFGAYGYRSTGVCVALRNWHNRGNLEAVEKGRGPAIAMEEEISLDDFHGLVELLLIAGGAMDAEDSLPGRLDSLYDSGKHLLT
jgi:putative aminopeptidase FrvX